MYEPLILQYRRYLAKRHCQWTWQRQTIAGVMLGCDEFSPEQLLVELTPRGVTRPSFYLVLSELLESGIASEARMGEMRIIRIARQLGVAGSRPNSRRHDTAWPPSC